MVSPDELLRGRDGRRCNVKGRTRNKLQMPPSVRVSDSFALRFRTVGTREQAWMQKTLKAGLLAGCRFPGLLCSLRTLYGHTPH